MAKLPKIALGAWAWGNDGTFGNNFTAETEELEKVAVQNIKEEEKKINVKFKGDYSFDISTELNIIGKNTDEALYELEYYLSKAKAKGYETVRIVHGKGTGALRKAVQEYLKKSKYVASFRLGGYGEGDVGVTIVTMKK